MRNAIACSVMASLLLTGSALANGEASRVGPAFAVTSFDKEEGFKMSTQALLNLGVRFATLQGSGPFVVPKDTLIRIKHSTGVYRRFEGWIGFVLVQVRSQDGKTARIVSEDLQPGDEVAVSGASFLRLTEADLNADTVDSCAH